MSSKTSIICNARDICEMTASIIHFVVYILPYIYESIAMAPAALAPTTISPDIARRTTAISLDVTDASFDEPESVFFLCDIVAAGWGFDQTEQSMWSPIGANNTPTNGQPDQITAMLPYNIAVVYLFASQDENESITSDAQTAEGSNAVEQKNDPGEVNRKRSELYAMLSPNTFRRESIYFCADTANNNPRKHLLTKKN
jgi:hypothetical protein